MRMSSKMLYGQTYSANESLINDPLGFACKTNFGGFCPLFVLCVLTTQSNGLWSSQGQYSQQMLTHENAQNFIKSTKLFHLRIK